MCVMLLYNMDFIPNSNIYLSSWTVSDTEKVENKHRQTLTMAAVHYPERTLRESLHWDETECLNYYGMLSLHEMFEVVGSQLSETDVEALSFLLNETYPAPHPLDPVGWTVEPAEDDPEDSGVAPSPQLLKAWRRLKPSGSQHATEDLKFKSGLEVLLELERRGYISDGNLEPLLQLLRVLTRHDLLPFVSHKRRRTGNHLHLKLFKLCNILSKWSFSLCIKLIFNFVFFSLSRKNWTAVWIG